MKTRSKATLTLRANLARSAGFGEAPQQAFLQAPRGAKIASVYTLALLAVSCSPENGAKNGGHAFLRFLRFLAVFDCPD